MTRRDQSDRTKLLVIAAAAEEFDANGYAGGSIGGIAARLDMTKGAVAYHFASKASLAAAIIDEEVKQMRQMVDDIDGRGLRGVNALVAAVRSIIARADTDVVFRAAYRLNREHSAIDTHLRRPHLLWIGHMERFLDQAKADGEVHSDLDVAHAARAVAAMFLGEYQLSRELDRLGKNSDDMASAWTYLLASFTVDPRQIRALVDAYDLRTTEARAHQNLCDATMLSMQAQPASHG